MAEARRIVVDTSVFIDHIRQKVQKQTTYERLIKRGVQSYISLITYAELYAGKSVWEKKEAQRELDELLAGVSLVIPDEEIAQAAGKLRVKAGIDLLDGFIAATALKLKLPLFTLNRSDFSTIKGLLVFDSMRLSDVTSE